MGKLQVSFFVRDALFRICLEQRGKECFGNRITREPKGLSI